LPKSVLEKELLQQAYSEHLNSFPWDIYLTQTFKRTRRDGTNAVSSVWRILEDKFDCVRAFIAVEPHYLDGIHLHGLLRCIPWQDNLPIRMSKYLMKAFGWNTYSLARSQGIISWYCTKYVVKENNFFYKGDKSAWLNT